MRWHSRRIRRLLPLSTALIALAGTIPALASTYQASPARLAPDHPLPPGCQGFSPGRNFPGAEVEPMIDVDRSSGKQNLIAVYQQDRFSNGGAHGLWTDVSHNGGLTWAAVAAAPAFSRCTGGAAVGNDFERSSDPWVSISPNGNAFQIAIAFNTSDGGFGGPSAVLVSRSTTHGNTWGTPIALIRDTSTDVLNDKESITADPNRSNNVYAVWDRLVSPGNSTMASDEGFEHALSFRGPTWFARTTNGGASWEPARIIVDTPEFDQTIGNVIRVAPSHPTAAGVRGGELLNGFDLIEKHGNPHLAASFDFNVAVNRSFDQGVSWSRPLVVDKIDLAQVCFAFDCSTRATRVRTGDILPEFAVDRTTGFFYGTWQDKRFTGHSQIAFSMSKDGGASWSPTIRINPPADVNQAFTPTVHVADDGTVGVAYYRLSDPTSMSDVFFVHCHQAGPGHTGTQDCSKSAAWNANGITHVAGPFNMANAPIARGHFVGDYFGLTDAGRAGFRPFYDLATDLPNQTDNFTNTVCPSSGC